MSQSYVVHYCKNSKCNNCFIDVDLYDAQNKPPKHKYCLDCVAKGFNNEKTAEATAKINRIKKMVKQ